jgi:hypothetical protein
MRKIFFLISICLLSSSFTFAATTYSTKTENGHTYKVMKVLLDGKSNIVVSVVENASPAQSLKTLTEVVGGTDAINGGFFCPQESAYARCD